MVAGAARRHKIRAAETEWPEEQGRAGRIRTRAARWL